MMIVLDVLEAIATVIGGVLRVLFHVVDVLVSIPDLFRASGEDRDKRGDGVPHEPAAPEAERALKEAAESRMPQTSVPTIGDKAS
jgi:hypothetical protein